MDTYILSMHISAPTFAAASFYRFKAISLGADEITLTTGISVTISFAELAQIATCVTFSNIVYDTFLTCRHET
jgi:hypothetical protein